MIQGAAPAPQEPRGEPLTAPVGALPIAPHQPQTMPPPPATMQPMAAGQGDINWQDIQDWAQNRFLSQRKAKTFFSFGIYAGVKKHQIDNKATQYLNGQVPGLNISGLSTKAKCFLCQLVAAGIRDYAHLSTIANDLRSGKTPENPANIGNLPPGYRQFFHNIAQGSNNAALKFYAERAATPAEAAEPPRPAVAPHDDRLPLPLDVAPPPPPPAAEPPRPLMAEAPPPQLTLEVPEFPTEEQIHELQDRAAAENTPAAYLRLGVALENAHRLAEAWEAYWQGGKDHGTLDNENAPETRAFLQGLRRLLSVRPTLSAIPRPGNHKSLRYTEHFNLFGWDGGGTMSAPHFEVGAHQPVQNAARYYGVGLCCTACLLRGMGGPTTLNILQLVTNTNPNTPINDLAQIAVFEQASSPAGDRRAFETLLGAARRPENRLAQNLVRRLVFSQTAGDRAILSAEIMAHMNDWSWMGAHYHQPPVPPHAIPEDQWQAQIGDLEGNMIMGGFYSSPKSPEEIARIVSDYSRLAANGNRIALARIATMAERGLRVAWAALENLARAHASAEYGFMALRQLAVEGSPVALDILQRLHADNVPGAAQSLAWAFEWGPEGIRNLEAAAELYYAAQQAGDPVAHANLVGMAALGAPRAQALVARIMQGMAPGKDGAIGYTGTPLASSAAQGDTKGTDAFVNVLARRGGGVG